MSLGLDVLGKHRLDIFEPESSSPATLVVASSTSLYPDRADYVCDGTADDVEIQAAITAATGGRVVLLEGTFNCIADITIPANTVLEGQGWGTILSFSGAAIENALTINGHNIAIKNLKATLAAGAGASTTRPNVIKGNGFDNLLFEDLWVVGDDSVADDGSEYRQCGLWFQYTEDSRINNCLVEGCKRHGINFYGECWRNAVTGTTSRDNTQHGMKLHGANHTAVSGCIFEGNTGDGVNMSSAPYNAFSGCTFDGNGGSGIFPHSSHHNSIAGCTSEGNTGHGISGCGADWSSYSANTCYNNGNCGMVLDGQGISCVGNSCYDNGNHGIFVVDPYITVSGNVCESNGGGASWDGIRLEQSAHYCAITGNVCQANQRHGISVYEVDRCTIVGNVCKDSVQGDGVNVEGDATHNADYHVVSNNICTGNADDGIAIEGTTDANKNIVTSNQLLGNSGTALVDNGTATQTDNNITS